MTFGLGTRPRLSQTAKTNLHALVAITRLVWWPYATISRILVLAASLTKTLEQKFGRAPLLSTARFFCWLATKELLPTNERRFRHHLSSTAACLSCSQDEDTYYLLLLCPEAREVWSYFCQAFDVRGPSILTNLWTSMALLRTLP
jgi:hypothetical protein